MAFYAQGSSRIPEEEAEMVAGRSKYSTDPASRGSVKRMRGWLWFIGIIAVLAFLGMIAAVTVASLAFQDGERFWIGNSTDPNAMVTRGDYSKIAIKKDDVTDIGVIEFCTGDDCDVLEGALEASINPVDGKPLLTFFFNDFATFPIKGKQMISAATDPTDTVMIRSNGTNGAMLGINVLPTHTLDVVGNASFTGNVSFSGNITFPTGTVTVADLTVTDQLLVTGTLGTSLNPHADDTWHLGTAALRYHDVRSNLATFDTLTINTTSVNSGTVDASSTTTGAATIAGTLLSIILSLFV